MLDIQIFNDAQLNKYVAQPFIIHMLAYWIPSIIYLFFDFYLEKKGIIEKYKTQKKPVNWKLYPKTVIIVLINQCVFTLGLLYLMKDFHRYHDLNTREQPTFIGAIFWMVKVWLLILISDFLFYWLHYLMHCRWLYKYIHKIHHEWKAPVACRALYAHPVEHIFGNVFPFYAPIYLLGLSWGTLLLWTIVTSINTTFVHSGYSFYLLGNDKHDLHHQKFNVNYGVMVWDNFFGTSDEDDTISIQNKKRNLFLEIKEKVQLIHQNSTNSHSNANVDAEEVNKETEEVNKEIGLVEIFPPKSNDEDDTLEVKEIPHDEILEKINEETEKTIQVLESTLEELETTLDETHEEETETSKGEIEISKGETETSKEKTEISKEETEIRGSSSLKGSNSELRQRKSVPKVRFDLEDDNPRTEKIEK